jgi:hypothetical protein
MPPFVSAEKLNSQHLDALDVKRISFDFPSHCDVVAFMAFEFFRVRNRQHFLVPIGHHDHLGTCSKTFLRAFGGLGVCTLSATLGVGYVTLDRSFVSGKRHVRHHEQHYAKSKTEQK